MGINRTRRLFGRLEKGRVGRQPMHFVMVFDQDAIIFFRLFFCFFSLWIEEIPFQVRS